jgi:hypothetical protein
MTATGTTPAPDTSSPRSRRALLAGALGGLAATVSAALGRPQEASAAPGSPLIIGSEANNSALVAYTARERGAWRFGVPGPKDSPDAPRPT